MKSEIKVAETEWLYDNIVPMTIEIFKLNYDFFYDLDYGYHDENEKKFLNSDGEQFVVLNNNPKFDKTKDFPSYIALSLNEAKEHVEKTLNKKLNWKLY